MKSLKRGSQAKATGIWNLDLGTDSQASLLRLNIATRLSAISMRQSPMGNGFTIPDVARVGWLSGILASREKMEPTLRRKFLEDTFPPVLPAPDFFAFIAFQKLDC